MYLIDLLKQYNCLTNEYMNLYHLLQIYCKNASFLKVLRTTAIENQENFNDEIESDLSW
jgi:hypothetical protein